MCLHVSLPLFFFLESIKVFSFWLPCCVSNLFYLLNSRFQVVLQPLEKIVLTGLKKWDLAICRFRGRNDITDGETAKLQILSYDDKAIVLAGLKDEYWLSPVQRSQWHNRLRSHQAQNFIVWWQRNSPCRTEGWVLAICRFRGRNDVTDWEATKLRILLRFERNCQRYC